MTSHAIFKDFFSVPEVSKHLSFQPPTKPENSISQIPQFDLQFHATGFSHLPTDNQNHQNHAELETYFRVFPSKKLNCKRIESILNEQFFSNHFNDFKICQKYINSTSLNTRNKKCQEKASNSSTENSENANLSSNTKNSFEQSKNIDFLLKQAYQKYKDNFYSKSEPQKQAKNYDFMKNKSLITKISLVSSIENIKNESVIKNSHTDVDPLPTPFRLSIERSLDNAQNNPSSFSKQIQKEPNQESGKVNRRVYPPVSCSVIFDKIEVRKIAEPLLRRKVYRVC